MEQMIPFLVSLWLHALVVSPSSATHYGMLYVTGKALCLSLSLSIPLCVYLCVCVSLSVCV